jgi:ABC-type nitrate/sulfonate/bicarbonate transport system permease component
MQIELLGGVGIGLVWGWCLGFWNAGEAKSRRWLNTLASALAVLPLVALNQTFAGWHATVYFAVAVVLSLIIHLVWRYYLRRQVAS